MSNRQDLDYEPVTPARRVQPGDEEFIAPDWARPSKSLADDHSAREEATSGAPAASLTARSKQTGSTLRRGHLLSFFGLVLFTLAMYLRPEDYIAALAPVKLPLIIALLTLAAFIPSQLALEGTLTVRPTEVNLALLLCLAGLLSIPLAYSPGAAFDAWWAFMKIVLIFIVFVNAVRTERRWRVMLFLILGISCFLSLVSLNDYRLGNLTVEGYRVKGAVAHGVFEDPNDLAAHLVSMVPIVFVLGLSRRGLVRKLFYWSCAVIFVATIVLTFSRGGFLGLIAVVMVLTWKLGRRNRVVTIGLALVACVLFLTFAPGGYWRRVASIFLPSLDPLGSASARSQLLKQSILVALRHPLFGIGIGNFPIVSSGEHVTHNAYTQVAAETGLAACVCFVLFFVKPLRRWREIEERLFVSHRSSRFYYLSIGLQASLIGYMVSSFFISIAYYPVPYYLIGFAICLHRIYLSSGAAVDTALIPDQSMARAEPAQAAHPL